MTLLRRLAALFLLLASPLAAQDNADIVTDQSQFPVADSGTPILTVDLERLFQQSRFGQRVVEDYNADRAELASENRRIAEALRAEELALAERRPDMDPAVFQAEAEAFDEKAQDIRQAQDAKQQALEESLVTGREDFLAAARPVLGELLIERRATVIVEQRSIVVSLNRIDVTDEAVIRIDEALGDGRSEEDTPEQP